VAPNGARLAEFSDRVVAYIIDYAILAAVGLILTVPVLVYQFSIMTDWANEMAERPPPETLGEVYGEMFAALAPVFWAYLLLFVVNLGIYYVYRVEMMFRTGQTVGKRVMKLRVIPLDPTTSLTRAMAAKRWFIDSVAAVVVPLLQWIDGLWQLWDKPYRQCLHDKFASTVVVKAEA
jgi:uncharacterized RDD family membrane protein YckC